MIWKKLRNRAVEYTKAYTVGLIGYATAPSFLIIGAQKAGTTALFAYLDAHPQIVQGATKEMHYFDNFYQRGARWYHALFPMPHNIRPDQISYEATPKYIYDPAVPARIHAYNPHLKLIALVRNPVDRAYSAWNVYTWNKFGYTSFDDMVRGEIALIERDGTGYPGDRHAGFLHRGIYADQLARYFTLFPREQVLILSQESLRGDAAGALHTVTDFLGLRDQDWSAQPYTPANAGTYTEPMSADARARLTTFFRPHNERLYALLGVDYGWERSA